MAQKYPQDFQWRVVCLNFNVGRC